MKKKQYIPNPSNPNGKKYQCKRCEGTGMVQSEDGSKAIECPKCDGSGIYKPFA